MVSPSRTPLRDQFWRLFFRRYAAPDGGLMGYLPDGGARFAEGGHADDAVGKSETKTKEEKR